MVYPPTPGDASPWVPLLSRCDRAQDRHESYVHCSGEDVCLCAGSRRPCSGGCGLPDFGWLGVRCEWWREAVVVQ
jgi:hypothetical protein